MREAYPLFHQPTAAHNATCVPRHFYQSDIHNTDYPLVPSVLDENYLWILHQSQLFLHFQQSLDRNSFLHLFSLIRFPNSLTVPNQFRHRQFVYLLSLSYLSEKRILHIHVYKRSFFLEHLSDYERQRRTHDHNNLHRKLPEGLSPMLLAHFHQ